LFSHSNCFFRLSTLDIVPGQDKLKCMLLIQKIRVIAGSNRTSFSNFFWNDL
jgi:hypothetical protein